jgi:hypothetical protein
MRQFELCHLLVVANSSTIVQATAHILGPIPPALIRPLSVDFLVSLTHHVCLHARVVPCL